MSTYFADQERRGKRRREASESSGLPSGDSRKPKFGEWMRGIWASEDNPIRDGMYVETIRRTGRTSPGTFYRLTDGNGKFWEFEAADTLYLGKAASRGADR